MRPTSATMSRRPSPAQAAYEHVLARAGASLQRDAVDERVIERCPRAQGPPDQLAGPGRRLADAQDPAGPQGQRRRRHAGRVGDRARPESERSRRRSPRTATTTATPTWRSISTLSSRRVCRAHLPLAQRKGRALRPGLGLDLKAQSHFLSGLSAWPLKHARAGVRLSTRACNSTSLMGPLTARAGNVPAGDSRT